jgi:ribonuclease P protein component
MNKFPIIKKRKDFLRAAKGVTMVSKNVMLQAVLSLSEAENKPARIGFTATKRLGKAHIRNKTKRRLRAIVREVYDTHTLPDADYVLVGRYNTCICPFSELKKDVVWSLKKVNKLLQEEKHKDENIADRSN